MAAKRLEGDVLLLDAGNFIARKNPPYGYDTPVSLQCLRQMGYNALAIGDKEIGWGLEDLEKALAEQGLLPVSNNVMDAETGAPRFDPFTIVKVGRLKVGVTATIGGAAVVPRTLKEREGITIADPIERSRAVLEEMRKKKVDVALLIAHAGTKKAEEWTDSLSGYDVMLVGYGARKLDEPEKMNGVIVAATGSRSNWLGELSLTVEKKRITTFSGRSYEMKLDEGPFDEGVKALTWAKLELDENGNRIRKGQERKKKKPGEEAKEEPVKKELSSSYLGGETCALCHADVQEFWSGTAHAKAFQTVAESEEWEKPECWNCHVLGYGEKTGHPKGTLEPSLWNVQCEACHGKGTEHARGAARAKVDEKACLPCHTKKWSPDFDFEKYVEKVACTAATRHG